MRIGVSCVIEGDMETLGTLLVMMKSRGAKDIGFEIISTAGKEKKLSLPPPKGKRPNTCGEGVEVFLQSLPVGAHFRALDVRHHNERLGLSPHVVGALSNRVTAGALERLSVRGHYRKVA